MDFKLLIKTLGGASIGLGFITLVPGLFSFLDSNGSAWPFFITSLLCLLIGLPAWGALRDYQAEFDNKTSFALLTLVWLGASLIGGLPFFLSGVLSDPVQALFESVSGFTGTGASVITDVERLDRSLLLWRSMTQWLGGIAIIISFVTFMPFFGMGGVQRFKSETSGPQKDRIASRTWEAAGKLCLLYTVLSAILVFAFFQNGMPWFDAVNHALTVISAGGFSTKNAGLAYFAGENIHMIAAIFMLLATVNFALYYRLLIQRDGTIVHDTELKWFGGIFAVALLFVASILMRFKGLGLGDAGRQAFFLVASICSSSGIASQDGSFWPSAVQVIILALIVMGGMSGSAAGGIKCIRLAAACKLMAKQFTQAVHPNAVLTIKANGRVMTQETSDAIWSLLFIYFLTFSVAALILASKGLDLFAASGAALTALSNSAPATAHLGISLNYAMLPAISKTTLMICMLLGRLEFFAVLVIFTPAYWRK